MKSAESLSGVYKITCVPTGKFYIGSAVCIRARWNVHRHQLRRGTHINKHLQRAWAKHGERAFRFEVTEEVAPALLLDREQAYLDLLRPCDPKIGFNINPKAESCLGARLDDEARLKHSECREWVVTSPTGATEAVHNLTLFCERHRLDFWKLRDVARGKADTTQGGWHCRAADVSQQEWEAMRQRARERNQVGDRQQGPWVAVWPDGREETVRDLREFAGRACLRVANLRMMVRGVIRSFRGFQCRHISETFDALHTRVEVAVSQARRCRTYVVTHPDQTEEVVLSLPAFCARFGLERTCMYDVAAGRRSCHRGFRCRRVESASPPPGVLV